MRPRTFHFVTVFVILISGSLAGQSSSKCQTVIGLENNYLYAGINNRLTIIATQEEPISLEQVSATVEYYSRYDPEIYSPTQPIDLIEENGRFMIRPTGPGEVRISIMFRDTTETHIFRVKFVDASVMLAGVYPKKAEKFSANYVKAVLGIMAPVICCGFDAKCDVLEFELIRAPNSGSNEKVINHGARFETEAQRILSKAESGDLFIFRNIKARCATTYTQYLEDMIIEIE